MALRTMLWVADNIPKYLTNPAVKIHFLLFDIFFELNELIYGYSCSADESMQKRLGSYCTCVQYYISLDKFLLSLSISYCVQLLSEPEVVRATCWRKKVCPCYFRWTHREVFTTVKWLIKWCHRCQVPLEYLFVYTGVKCRLWSQVEPLPVPLSISRQASHLYTTH